MYVIVKMASTNSAWQHPEGKGGLSHLKVGAYDSEDTHVVAAIKVGILAKITEVEEMPTAEQLIDYSPEYKAYLGKVAEKQASAPVAQISEFKGNDNVELKLNELSKSLVALSDTLAEVNKSFNSKVTLLSESITTLVAENAKLQQAVLESKPAVVTTVVEAAPVVAETKTGKAKEAAASKEAAPAVDPLTGQPL
jgi:ATP-dependent Lon protease